MLAFSGVKVYEIASIPEPVKQPSCDAIALGEQIERIDNLAVYQAKICSVRDEVGVGNFVDEIVKCVGTSALEP